MTDQQVLDAEDAKLFTLAKGARARVGAREGAAVRDETGRTYASASVTMQTLQLTALQAAVAQAVASGARGLEAAVLVTDGDADPVGLAVARELGGPDLAVIVLDGDGREHGPD